VLGVCVASAEPLIATHGASQILTDKLFAQDGERVMMLLGSDDLGRDALTRVIHGFRITLGLFLASTLRAFFDWVTVFLNGETAKHRIPKNSV